MYLLYWYFQQNQCLNIKKHAVHRHGASILVGLSGSCPACPCVKTALDMLV